jgi:tetratricopeptide (TPR) repeat protein
MSRVFISHSAKDRDFVEREIIAPLEQHGIKTWYSKDKIRGGAIWEKKIQEGLKACDWFLVAVTPDSINSEWVWKEVRWALKHRQERVLPVLCADCNPEDLHFELDAIQHFNFCRDMEAEREKLIREIKGADPTPEQLYEQAQAAYQAEDWATAIAKLQSLLQLQPDHSAARTLLQQAQLPQLYASGLAHFQAQRWREAVADLRRVCELDVAYRDAAALLTEAQERVNAGRIKVLFDEADAAAANEIWPVAIKRLEEILALKPTHTEARQKLDEARRRQSLAQSLAKLYEVGLKRHQEGRWAEALDVLRDMPADYKDVAALVATAEARLARPVEPSPEPIPEPIPEPTPEPPPDPVPPRPSFVAALLSSFTKKRWLVLTPAVVLLFTMGLLAYLFYEPAKQDNKNVSTHTVSSGPTDVGANAATYYLLGENFYEKKDYVNAERQFTKAAEMAQNYSTKAAAQYYARLGDSLRMQNKTFEAKVAYDTAEKYDPTNQVAKDGLQALKQ